MKFREHRGSLADSMATCIELSDSRMDTLLAHLRKSVEQWPTFPRIDRDTITLYAEGPDNRISWPATYVVYLKDYGVMGMIDEAPE